MEDDIWIEKDKIMINVEKLNKSINNVKILNKLNEEIYCGELKNEIILEKFYIDDVLNIYVEKKNNQWLLYSKIRRKRGIALKRINNYIEEFKMKTEELINAVR